MLLPELEALGSFTAGMGVPARCGPAYKRVNHEGRYMLSVSFRPNERSEEVEESMGLDVEYRNSH